MKFTLNTSIVLERENNNYSLINTLCDSMVSIISMVMKAERRVVRSNNPKPPKPKPQNLLRGLSEYKKMKERRNATTTTSMSVSARLSYRKSTMSSSPIFSHFLRRESLPTSSSELFPLCINTPRTLSEITISQIPTVSLSRILHLRIKSTRTELSLSRHLRVRWSSMIRLSTPLSECVSTNG